MDARFESRKADYRDDQRRAWQIANYAGAAFAGGLKDLSYYLKNESEDKSRGGMAMLGALLAMKKKGVSMTVERIKRAA